MNENNQVKPKALIQVRDLLIQFRLKNKKLYGVKGVSFDIYQGEIFSIVGESGSGKTTIGRAIAGIQPLKDGCIYMNSKLIRGKIPELTKTNQFVNNKLNEIENNNILLSEKWNEYFNNFKKVYHENLSNKKNNSFKHEGLNWLKKLKNDKYLIFFKTNYHENLSSFRSIAKRYQRTNIFIASLNEYIPNLSIELEKEIVKRNNNNLTLVQKNIILSKEIYELILTIEKTCKKFENTLSLIQTKNLMKKLMIIFQDIIKKHEKITDYYPNIKQNQKIIFLFFTTKKQRKKYLYDYYQQYLVTRKQFLKIYQMQYKKFKNNQDQKKLLELKEKFANSWLITKLDKKFVKNLIENLNNKNQLEIYVNQFLHHTEDSKIILFIKQLLLNKKTRKQKLLDINYLLNHNVFRDIETIKLFHEWTNNTSFFINEKDHNINNNALDFLEKEAIVEIINQATLFKKPTKRDLKAQKRKIQMIFQDPYGSINERISIAEVIAEGLNNFPEIYRNDNVRKIYLDEYNSYLTSEQEPLTLERINDKNVKNFLVLRFLKSVGLLQEHLTRYAHEFSGGQRQRIGIARSLILNPELVIADEPISALDVSIRSQILNLLKDFQQKFNLTYLFIAHDLSIVRFISDRIAVMYKGQIVELATPEELFINPLHPYTKALLSAIPIPNPNVEKVKTHFIYEPEKEHFDYNYDLPELVAFNEQHYVFANKREQENLKIIRK